MEPKFLHSSVRDTVEWESLNRYRKCKVFMFEKAKDHMLREKIMLLSQQVGHLIVQKPLLRVNHQHLSVQNLFLSQQIKCLSM